MGLKYFYTSTKFPPLYYYAGKKLEDGKGLGGRGRLTISRIDAMQSFYGLAIRENKGDSKAMSQATKAILHHYASTGEKPQHQFCPVGDKSWCSYQRDAATGEKTHQPIKDPLPPAVVKTIKPVFDRLGDKKFLAGCERCATQNANESLHHVVWGFAPKDQYTSASENNLAAGLGVLVFNSGVATSYSRLADEIGLSVTPNMERAWERIDSERIYGAEYKDLERVKTQRKRRKRKLANKADAFQHEEKGLQYKSQGFYPSPRTKGNGKKKTETKGKLNTRGKARVTTKNKSH